MHSGQNSSQENEALETDGYVTRLRMVGKKVLLARRRLERRQIERRLAVRRTRNISVMEEHRTGLDRRGWTERRDSTNRRDARLQSVGVDFKTSNSASVLRTDARKRALLKTLLDKTDLLK